VGCGNWDGVGFSVAGVRSGARTAKPAAGGGGDRNSVGG